MKYKFLAIAALMLSAQSLPSVAHAQFAANSNVPTDISADTADYRGDVIILTGQVDVRQADTRILADRMEIFTQAANNQPGNVDNFNRIEAEGNFYYITPEQEVSGARGVYEREKDTFTVTGNVVLLQGEENVVTGDTLIYNLTKREAKVIGTCKGRKCGETGRVKILIKNTQNNPPAS